MPNEKLPERPPAHRIQDILEHRHYNAAHMHMRYAATRDYLQLCAEIDHLRADLREAIEQKEIAWASKGIVSL